MNWLWEKIFGLKGGFLNEQGELSVGFNPKWPAEPLINAGSWNWLLGAMALAGLGYLLLRIRKAGRRRHERHWAMVAGVVALALVVLSLISGTVAFNFALAALALAVLFYVYPREGRSKGARISLGVMRAALLAFVIALLNRPVLNLGQDLVDPSVVAILVDDSISMSVKDLREGDPENSPTRLEGVINLLTGPDQALVRRLAQQHQVRFYEFDGTARQKGPGVGDGTGEAKEPVDVPADLTKTIQSLKADG